MTEQENYPGQKYQKLFNWLSDKNVIALQSEMDEVIDIVKEDFPEPLPDNILKWIEENNPYPENGLYKEGDADLEEMIWIVNEKRKSATALCTLLSGELEKKDAKNNDWKEECERLAGVADFWQKKYYEVVPPHQNPKIDNL